MLLEKRDAFSRNNVLHLWPFAIQDLRGLGAKKFYGKFCAGAIDHISAYASARLALPQNCRLRQDLAELFTFFPSFSHVRQVFVSSS